MPTYVYDESKFVKLEALKALAQRTKSEIAAATADSIKRVVPVGNTINFYRTAQAVEGETPAFSFDFPKEIFLDSLHTTFVNKFVFNAETYAGATNPSLDGKPVLVLGVKTTTDAESGTASDKISYSFINLESLIDVYEIAEGESKKVLSIADNKITFHVSSAANNAIKVKDDGLHVDMSGKADKVDRATAAIAQNPYNSETEAESYAAFNTSYSLDGHVALLDASGNPKDSGAAVATSAEVTNMLNDVFGEAA